MKHEVLITAGGTLNVNWKTITGDKSLTWLLYFCKWQPWPIKSHFGSILLGGELVEKLINTKLLGCCKCKTFHSDKAKIILIVRIRFQMTHQQTLYSNDQTICSIISLEFLSSEVKSKNTFFLLHISAINSWNIFVFIFVKMIQMV